MYSKMGCRCLYHVTSGLGNVEAKCSVGQAMKTQRGSGGRIYLYSFFNIVSKWDGLPSGMLKLYYEV
jgi:hypothetical protein